MRAKTLGELRAAITSLDDLPADTPITVLYDSDFGSVEGIDLLREEGDDNDRAWFSISGYQDIQTHR